MCTKNIIEIFQALLTPTLAFVTIYIANEQLKTNKKKLEIDLYERRLLVYEDVQKVLALFSINNRLSYNELVQFKKDVSKADFLFDQDISSYIDEIYKRGIKHEFFSKQYRDLTQVQPEGYDHQKICDVTNTQSQWFLEQSKIAETRFSKYLKIHQK